MMWEKTAREDAMMKLGSLMIWVFERLGRSSSAVKDALSSAAMNKAAFSARIEPNTTNGPTKTNGGKKSWEMPAITGPRNAATIPPAITVDIAWPFSASLTALAAEKR